MTIVCNARFIDGSFCFVCARDAAEAVEHGWQQVDGAWYCPWCNGTKRTEDANGTDSRFDSL